MEYKTCRDCAESKPLDQFYVKKEAKDGRATYCRACHRARNRRWHKDNAERSRQSKQRYYQQNRSRCVRHSQAYRARNLDACKAYDRQRYRQTAERHKRRKAAWRQANPQRVKDVRARWETENRERRRELRRVRYATDLEFRARCLAYQKQWRKENPDKRNKYDARRRSKRTAASEDIDRRVVYLRDGGRCYLCGDPVTYRGMHLDHNIPLSRGGAHIYPNVGCACADCNLRKHVKTAEEFLAEMEQTSRAQ